MLSALEIFWGYLLTYLLFSSLRMVYCNYGIVVVIANVK